MPKLEAQDWEFDSGLVAFLTGPPAIRVILGSFYRQQNEESPYDLPNATTRAALIDPQWISQLIQVEWLTAVQKAKHDKDRQN